MRRAFIENGHWSLSAKDALGAGEACDAGVQQKATLRVSALAGLVTIALFAGPELKLAIPEAQSPRAPLISQPEMVSYKPADRVPALVVAASRGQETDLADVTSSASARPKPMGDAALVKAPSLFAGIDVLDPATLKTGDMTVRLAGIAMAPEGKVCRRLDGLAVSCADRAVSYLQLLVKGRAVACDRAGTTPDGLDLGHCRIGETDIAEQMVRQGWAKATAEPEERFMVAEAAAKKQKLGIWRE
jgi:endonuclease YncB( thermonuclease family)